jgi:hypothetical protein
MNFVNHLQRINRLFRKDDRIRIEHISLYSALFNWWYHYEQNGIVAIAHKKMMKDSCIEDRHIYDCIPSELHDFGYVTYNAGPPVTISIAKPYTAPSEAPKLFKIPTFKQVLVREIIDRITLLKNLTT